MKSLKREYKFTGLDLFSIFLSKFVDIQRHEVEGCQLYCH